MSLRRMKYAAEQELCGSGLDWTIVRAAAFLEAWITVIGEPLACTGHALVFAPGRNPINFVSARAAGCGRLPVARGGRRGAAAGAARHGAPRPAVQRGLRRAPQCPSPLGTPGMISTTTLPKLWFSLM